MVDSIGKMRREIARLGWRTEHTRGGHLRCSHPARCLLYLRGEHAVRLSGLEELAGSMKRALAAGAGGDSSARIVT